MNRSEQSPNCSLVKHVSVSAFAACVLLVLGCSSNTPNGAHCSAPGGPVLGVADNHCSSSHVTVDPGICSSGVTNEDDAGAPETENVLYNREGDDDDCKYHIKWSASTVCENADVMLQVQLTAKSDGAGVAGATPWAEAFLVNQTHSAHYENQTYHEESAGNYSIGPIRFDAKGQWTLKFHFFPDACDVLESPHGHVAFFVNVP